MEHDEMLAACTAQVVYEESGSEAEPEAEDVMAAEDDDNDEADAPLVRPHVHGMLLCMLSAWHADVHAARDNEVDADALLVRSCLHGMRCARCTPVRAACMASRCARCVQWAQRLRRLRGTWLLRCWCLRTQRLTHHTAPGV
jgi:hypothetical protein